MASGTGNSFVGAGVSSDAAGSITAAAYPGGVPSGMNNPINQYTSSEMTSSFPGYLFKSLYGGGKRRKSRVQRRKRISGAKRGHRGGGTNYKYSVSVGEFFKMVENGVFRDGEKFEIITPNKTIWSYRIWSRIDRSRIDRSHIDRSHIDPPLIKEVMFEYGGYEDYPYSYTYRMQRRMKVGDEYFFPYTHVKVIKNDDKFVVIPGYYRHRVISDYYTYDTTKRTSQTYSPRSSKQWLLQTDTYPQISTDVTDMRVVGMGVDDAVAVEVQDFALVSHNATRKVNRHNPASRVLGNRDFARKIAQYLSPASDTAVKTGHRKTAKRSQSKSPPKKRSPSIDEVTDGMKDLMKSKSK